VWVRGKSLYFQPAPDLTTATPYQLTWQPAPNAAGVPVANFEQISLKRSLTVSRGIQVVIRSWNTKTGKALSASFPTSKPKTIQVGKSSVGAGAQIYTKTIPNLDSASALQRAQSWYEQLVAHEMKIEVTLPGDNTLDTTSIIKLGGTGTKFDQNYYPDSITRSLSLAGGYAMTVNAKNHAPESVALA
jgi:hypothetical protein